MALPSWLGLGEGLKQLYGQVCQQASKPLGPLLFPHPLPPPQPCHPPYHALPHTSPPPPQSFVVGTFLLPIYLKCGGGPCAGLETDCLTTWSGVVLQQRCLADAWWSPELCILERHA